MNTELVKVYRSTLTRPQLSDLWTAFIARRSAHTARAYDTGVKDFAAFLDLAPLDAVAALLSAPDAGAANRMVLEYKRDLVDRGLSAGTVNARLSALRAVVKLARMFGLVTWSIEIENERPAPRRDTRGPQVSDVAAILSATGADAKGARDRAIVRCLFDVGLRRSEVVALDLADVDLARRSLRVRGKGRGGEKETVTVPGPTLDALRDWLTYRGDVAGPLFRNADRAAQGDGRLTSGGVWLLLRTLSRRAGIAAVRPHGLRHTAATALAASGASAEMLRRWGRWSNLTTPARYIDNVNDLQGKGAAIVAAAV